MLWTFLPPIILMKNFLKPPADVYTPDLIDAADVILGKVGYGTASLELMLTT